MSNDVVKSDSIKQIINILIKTVLKKNKFKEIGLR